jgi:hypothetical protein
VREAISASAAVMAVSYFTIIPGRLFDAFGVCSGYEFLKEWAQIFEHSCGFSDFGLMGGDGGYQRGVVGIERDRGHGIIIDIIFLFVSGFVIRV